MKLSGAYPSVLNTSTEKLGALVDHERAAEDVLVLALPWRSVRTGNEVGKFTREDERIHAVVTEDKACATDQRADMLFFKHVQWRYRVVCTWPGILCDGPCTDKTEPADVSRAVEGTGAVGLVARREVHNREVLAIRAATDKRSACLQRRALTEVERIAAVENKVVQTGKVPQCLLPVRAAHGTGRHPERR